MNKQLLKEITQISHIKDIHHISTPIEDVFDKKQKRMKNLI
jgi:hypothetical protein